MDDDEEDHDGKCGAARLNPGQLGGPNRGSLAVSARMQPSQVGLRLRAYSNLPR